MKNMDLLREPKQRKLLFSAGLSWLFDAMEVGMISFIVTALAAEWKLGSEQVGLLMAINSIGMAVRSGNIRDVGRPIRSAGHFALDAAYFLYSKRLVRFGDGLHRIMRAAIHSGLRSWRGTAGRFHARIGIGVCEGSGARRRAA